MNRSDMALVDAVWLSERLEDPNVHVLEVTWDDDVDPSLPEHVPGAKCVYWKDFLWHDRVRAFPSPDGMRRRLRSLGIDTGQRLVIYGNPIQFGTYAFWALSALGLHRDVALLDGGVDGWRSAGLDLARCRLSDKSDKFLTDVDVEPCGARLLSDYASRDDVFNALGERSKLLLDLRSREEYSGDRVAPNFMNDYGAERGGRIPGARHLPYTDLLEDDGRFKSVAELRTVMDGVGAMAADEVITYCRLGHRGSVGWFALRHLMRRPDVAVYEGSWTEWGSMVGMPIEV